MNKVVLYARVSTDEQNSESQLLACREYAKRHELEVLREYVDEGISGKEESRPQFDAMLSAWRAGEFNSIVFYSLSRLSRNLRHAIELRDEFAAKNTILRSVSEPIDLTTPTGRAMVAFLCVMNELDREVIVARVRTGLQRAVSEGKKLGRKSARDDSAILALVDQGLSERAIAERLGISAGAVGRAKRARKATQSDAPTTASKPTISVA